MDGKKELPEAEIRENITGTEEGGAWDTESMWSAGGHERPQVETFMNPDLDLITYQIQNQVPNPDPIIYRNQKWVPEPFSRSDMLDDWIIRNPFANLATVDGPSLDTCPSL